MGTLVVEGGRVLLPDHSAVAADVVVDRDAGEIVAVDRDRSTGGTETLDADGGVVIPGLVNAHTHIAMTLLRGYADDKPLDAWLREDIWPVEATLTPEDVRAGAQLGVVEMIRSGTTTFADMYFHESTVADVVAEAGVRALLSYGAVTVDKEPAAAEKEVEDSVAVARDLDGRADGRIRGAVAPHSLTTVGEEHLQAAAAGAREAGVPLHLHANETADEVAPIIEETGQRPLAYAGDAGAVARGDLLAHCVHVDDAEIELLAESGATAVHCPASNMKLASGLAPVQDLLDAGASVALGTDGAASNNDLDLFDEMRDAAMVGKIAADRADAVDADAVVEMATRSGAAALGFDAGRIVPGAAADLAVVDLEAPHLTPPHDLRSHLVYAARGSDVRHTVCDGRVLMRDREVTVLDETAVRERAAAAAADAVERAE